MKYDILILGSGPGGYVAAIRAAQLGFKVGVVEKAEIGGVCLNWGCIPTKALLKSAQVFQYARHAADYGISIKGDIEPDLPAIVARSRQVAEGMSKGVQYLFKKNKIDLISGFGVVKPGKKIEVSTADGKKQIIEGEHIIIATGARSKELPNLPQDGKKIIGYRQAMTLEKLPKSMVVVGSGAIGSEFAFFFNSLGVQVTLVEFLPNVVPLEDEEVSKQLARSFKKAKMKVMLESSVEKVDTSGENCKVSIKTKKGMVEVEADIVLSAVGITTNIEGIGLEETGIKTEKGKVVVDDFYRTNVPGYYAIGDIVHGPALAHTASHEGITCVEKIAGKDVQPVDYGNIPACTYTSPEVASVGLTEKAAREAGYDIKVGKFPFTASGKASAAGKKEGFVKVIFDAKYGEWLGCHMIGENVTEMIAEVVVARRLETTGEEIIKSVHPHPTMSEAIMEAVAAAYDEVIHL
ncbi:dihydrolipoyl dehydrogenase [Candidatus Sulfidibacterium hydrothermale]|uniref:dihydrolipoyl dehydrogenase n=1 Tax=Candidatus Sulfidibacterium hydrothermale TaxID=2875962 RepID=UPI001F0A32A8|nr:dihydrolipoyl dehydrogenase [Candidatus Sulfidibacterium hydrothermale]UBM63564.1 dihydrolipoyl dehydrogenase [Candidatus Sulfidibacterium hydrothermale]